MATLEQKLSDTSSKCASLEAQLDAARARARTEVVAAEEDPSGGADRASTKEEKEGGAACGSAAATHEGDMDSRKVDLGAAQEVE